MFKYLILGLLAYWIYKRIFRVADAVRQDGNASSTDRTAKPTNTPPQKSNMDHSKGGEYVDYEEVE